MTRGSWPVGMATISHSFSSVVIAVALLCTVTTVTQAASLLTSRCGKTGNYTEGDTYEKNLVHVRRILANSKENFTTSVVGSIPDMVYGVALCGVDVSQLDCSECILSAFQDGAQECTWNKEAYLFYDQCSVEYSNRKLNPSSFSISGIHNEYDNGVHAVPPQYDKHFAKCSLELCHCCHR